MDPKGVAKWPFDSSSGLVIPKGESITDLGPPEIQKITRLSFKLRPTGANSIPKFENPSSGGGHSPQG